jgi:hypothetical protein
MGDGGNGRQLNLPNPVPMRAGATATVAYTNDNGGSISSSGYTDAGVYSTRVYASCSNTTGAAYLNSGATFSAEL